MNLLNWIFRTEYRIGCHPCENRNPFVILVDSHKSHERIISLGLTEISVTEFVLRNTNFACLVCDGFRKNDDFERATKWQKTRVGRFGLRNKEICARISVIASLRL
jgi:hypothetical protein